LKKAAVDVVGMVSIFTYDFPIAKEAFNTAGVRYQPLTNYPALIELAIEKGIVSPNEQEVLLKWRTDPSNWSGVL